MRCFCSILIFSSLLFACSNSTNIDIQASPAVPSTSSLPSTTTISDSQPTTIVEVQATTIIETTTTELEFSAPEQLNFIAYLTDGEIINGSDLADQDTLFWFWAPN